MQANQARLKTVQELSVLLNVSPFGLYHRIKIGAVPAYHFGRKILLDVEEVLKAMRRPVMDEEKDASK